MTEPTQEQILDHMKEDAIHLSQAVEMIGVNQLAFATLLERKGMKPETARKFVETMLGIMSEFGCDLVEAIEKIESGEVSASTVAVRPNETKH